MRSSPGCEGKHRKQVFACPNLVAVEFGCWRPSAPNWSVAWPPALPANKIPIVPRSSCVSPRVRQMPPSPKTWVSPNAPSGSGATALPSTACNRLEPAEILGWYLPHLFGEVMAPAMLDDLEPIVRSWRPDVVVHDSWEFAGAN